MINIYELKLTSLQQQILRFLLVKTGETFTAHVLSKSLSVSQPAISKALPYLEKEQLVIVVKDKLSKRLSIGINRNNPLTVRLKRADNLKLVYETGLFDALYDEFPGATVILFGSYSKGEDTIKSDIDIAVVGHKEKKLDLTKYEKLLERKIVINYYSSFKSIHKNLLNNILNGIVLQGSVEL